MMRWVGQAIILGLLVALLSACGGLAGEVAIVATLTPEAVAVAQTTEDKGYPASAPNLTNGEMLFAENCVLCHGENGDGNGELVQKGQVPAMQSFQDEAVMITKHADEYFDIITNGNIEKLMPPWKNSLSEQERWDVSAYALAMHYTDEQLALGKQVYEATCLECHGASGKGDGEKQKTIGGESYDLTYYRDMLFIADKDIVEVVRYGKGDSMPAQDGKLTDEEMLAVAAYTRTFSSVQSDFPAQEATEEPTSEGFSINGTVTNGTAGATLASGLIATLNYGNPTDGVTALDAPIQPDGSYQFTNVPLLPESAYYLYVMYQEQAFEGAVLETADITSDLTFPITVYEVSNDPAVIRIKQLDTQMEPFPQMEDESMGTGLLVTQKFTFENTSDRAFVLSQTGRYFSLLMVMPPGSIALNATRDQRYIVAQEQFAVIYVPAIMPGDTILDLVYFLPYEIGAVFDQPMNYPFEGIANVTINPKAIRLIDAGWTLDNSAPFVNQYTRTLTIAPTTSFKFELSGDVNDTTSNNPSLVTGDVLVPVIAAVIIIIAFIVLVAGYVRRRNPDAERQLLLRQIAELDAMHEHGQINHDAYQRQRKVLKDRLTTLMASQKNLQ